MERIKYGRSIVAWVGKISILFNRKDAQRIADNKNIIVTFGSGKQAKILQFQTYMCHGSIVIY